MEIYFDDKDLKSGVYFSIDSLVCESGKSFSLGERINRGGNAVVYRCSSDETGDEFAVKFLMVSSGKARERFKREAQLLEDLHHDHLIKFEDMGEIIKFNKCGAAWDKRRRVPFIVMELASQNLFDYLSYNNVSSETYIGQLRGLADALSVLHKTAIHRDIKPENILVTRDKWVLSDFGLCSFVRRTSDLTGASEKVGPKYWLSPEASNIVVGRKAKITSASDVFQLAAVFWFVINRAHPTGVLTKEDWRGPKYLFDVIYRALHHDPAQRPKDGAALVLRISEDIRKSLAA